jgi:hypothetical protein
LSRETRDKYASLLSFCAPCPACGGRAFYETIGQLTFYEIINLGSLKNEWGCHIASLLAMAASKKILRKKYQPKIFL